MNKKMHIKVTGQSNPRLTELEIGGELVPFVGLNLDWKRSEVPIATVELPYLESEVEAEMLVSLNPATARALKKMGWRPPLTDDPSVSWLDTKEWQMLALLLLASGGDIHVPERLMVEADFEKITIEVAREDSGVTYRALVDERNDPGDI